MDKQERIDAAWENVTQLVNQLVSDTQPSGVAGAKRGWGYNRKLLFIRDTLLPAIKDNYNWSLHLGVSIGSARLMGSNFNGFYLIEQALIAYSSELSANLTLADWEAAFKSDTNGSLEPLEALINQLKQLHGGR